MILSKNLKLAGAIVLGFGILCTGTMAQDGENVVATVNGEVITEEIVKIAESQIGSSFGLMPEEQKRQVIVGVLVDLYLLAQEARKDGLDNTDDYRQRLEFLTVQSLRDEYFAKNVNDLISDEDIKTRFDENNAESSGEMEISASHILVETEDEAKEIIELLNEGGDFAELAKEKSTGPSGPNGGQLGFFGKGRMVEPFETAAFRLEAGDYTKEPVETQFGWHVIMAHEKREKAAPPFEQIEAQLRQEMIREKYEEILSDLKSSANIVINEDGE